MDPNHLTKKRPKPMFPMEWWRPKSIKDDPKEVPYESIFSSTKSWERDPLFKKRKWQFASSAMFGWKSRMSVVNMSTRGLTIPKTVLGTVQGYLKKLEEDEVTEDEVE